jgi:hypothetical protein
MTSAVKNLDELAGVMDATSDEAPAGTGWSHQKSGGLYTVIGPAIREADMVPCILYHDLTDDRVWWIRPASEFLDGRFVREPECDC